jgi:hypothetical protein
MDGRAGKPVGVLAVLGAISCTFGEYSDFPILQMNVHPDESVSHTVASLGEFVSIPFPVVPIVIETTSKQKFPACDIIYSLCLCPYFAVKITRHSGKFGAFCSFGDLQFVHISRIPVTRSRVDSRPRRESQELGCKSFQEWPFCRRPRGRLGSEVNLSCGNGGGSN